MQQQTIAIRFISNITGGTRVDTIKALRQLTGLGLKEAKDFVDDAVTIHRFKINVYGNGLAEQQSLQQLREVASYYFDATSEHEPKLPNATLSEALHAALVAAVNERNYAVCTKLLEAINYGGN